MDGRVAILVATCLLFPLFGGATVGASNPAMAQDETNATERLEYTVYGHGENYTGRHLIRLEFTNPTEQRLEFPYVVTRQGQVVHEGDYSVPANDSWGFNVFDYVNETGEHDYYINGEYAGTIDYEHGMQANAINARQQVAPGEEVRYRAYVINNVNVTLTRELNITLDGETIDSYNMTIDGVESRQINGTFQAPEEDGEYKLRFGQGEESIHVSSNTATEADGGPSSATRLLLVSISLICSVRLMRNS